MKRFAVLLAVVSLSVLQFGQSAHAATKYWDTSTAAGIQGGPGIWDTGTTALWSTDRINGNDPLLTWTAGDGATFYSPTTATAITVAEAGVSASVLSFTYGGYTLQGGPITLGGSATITSEPSLLASTITSDIFLSATGTVSNAASLTLGNVNAQGKDLIFQATANDVASTIGNLSNSGSLTFRQGVWTIAGGNLTDTSKSGGAYLTFSNAALNRQTTVNYDGGASTVNGRFRMTGSPLGGAGATFNIRGGAVTVDTSANPVVIGTNNGTYAVNVSSGSFNVTAASMDMQIANNGTTAALTVSDTGSVSIGATATTQALSLGFGINAGAGGVGTLNLNAGGTLATSRSINQPAGSTGVGTVNFDGGTLKARDIANATWLSLPNAGSKAVVKAGGAKIDTNSFAMGIGQALLHDSTLGATADGGLTLNDTGTTKGTLTLSGVSTYTGPTTVAAGTLALASAGTINNTSGVQINAGATFNVAAKAYVVAALSGAGTANVGASLPLTASQLLPGDGGVGTLTISGDSGALALADNATYSFELGGTTASPTSDLVNLTGANSTVGFGANATLALSNLGGASLDPTGKTFVLFDYTGTNPTLPTWTINYGTTGWSGGVVSVNSGSSQIELSGLVAVVPEPSTLALLAAGLVGLLAYAWRKRK